MNLRISILFCLLTACLCVGKSFALPVSDEAEKGGTGVITGRIVDQDNLPLPGAVINIKSINETVISDVNGFYRIVKLEPGDYQLQITYIGFRSESQTASVKNGQAQVVNFVLTAGVDLNEVIVNGALQGQTKALNQQKNRPNIGNIISSDQVGRFPDANVGDAIKRIPGINVQYDQGEARFGQIRGTSPELNSVTINGDRIPSAEAETRSIQLDLVPSDMIQTIEVNKVVTPDMDADAIGGSVNLVTKSSPYKRRLSGTLASNYNLLPEKATFIGSLMYGERFANDKLGVVLSASYQNNQLGSDNIEATWEEGSGAAYISDFQIRTYQVRRERQSYSAAFDYTFNPNHKIELKGIYNHRKDWENRFRLQFKDITEPDVAGNSVTELRRQTKGGSTDEDAARLEDQKAMNFSLGGEHFLGALKLNWKGSFAKADENRPHERYIAYRAKKTNVNGDLSDAEKPIFNILDSDKEMLNTNYELKELTEQFQYTKDLDWNFRLNAEIPISRGDFANTLKTGFNYRSKKKMRDNQFNDYSPTDEDAFNAASLNHLSVKSKNDFLAGNYVAGNYVNNQYLANLNFGNTSEFDGETVPEELAGNFDATEKVSAAYLRFDQQLGARFSLVAGLRAERTAIEYAGYEFHVDDNTLTPTAKERDNYTNVLPSLIAKYSLSNDTKLKGAWTNTIARPKYFDLVPHVEIKQEDSEVSVGNPSLEPTRSMNFDLIMEHYYESIGYFTAGAFAKKITDVIISKQLRDYTWAGTMYDKFNQPVNAGDATLYGFEFAFQRQLDFLPGFLKQIGFYANYTYTRSRLKNVTIEGRENDHLTLNGTPENILNTSLYYEGKKLSVRASLNFADDFIDELGSAAFFDRYYDKVTYLDMNASYAFSKKLRIFAEANNLLNTPLRYYQGTEKRTMQAEYYNLKFNVGLKFDL